MKLLWSLTSFSVPKIFHQVLFYSLGGRGVDTFDQRADVEIIVIVKGGHWQKTVQ